MCSILIDIADESAGDKFYTSNCVKNINFRLCNTLRSYNAIWIMIIIFSNNLGFNGVIRNWTPFTLYRLHGFCIWWSCLDLWKLFVRQTDGVVSAKENESQLGEVGTARTGLFAKNFNLSRVLSYRTRICLVWLIRMLEDSVTVYTFVECAIDERLRVFKFAAIHFRWDPGSIDLSVWWISKLFNAFFIPLWLGP